MFLLGMITSQQLQAGPLGPKDVTVNLQMLDSQMFRKENYGLKIFMIAAVTVCFFLVIIYLLFIIA